MILPRAAAESSWGSRARSPSIRLLDAMRGHVGQVGEGRQDDASVACGVVLAPLRCDGVGRVRVGVVEHVHTEAKNYLR